MSRSYSPELHNLLDNLAVYRLGTDLAKACVNANLPAAYVAQVFDTTRATIHTWFRGGAIRPKKRARIETFIALIEEDLQKGILPCKNLRDSKAYLRDMVGRPIRTAREHEAG